MDPPHPDNPALTQKRRKRDKAKNGKSIKGGNAKHHLIYVRVRAAPRTAVGDDNPIVAVGPPSETKLSNRRKRRPSMTR